jgi:hypothetical protein
VDDTAVNTAGGASASTAAAFPDFCPEGASNTLAGAFAAPVPARAAAFAAFASCCSFIARAAIAACCAFRSSFGLAASACVCFCRICTAAGAAAAPLSGEAGR